MHEVAEKNMLAAVAKWVLTTEHDRHGKEKATSADYGHQAFRPFLLPH